MLARLMLPAEEDTEIVPASAWLNPLTLKEVPEMLELAVREMEPPESGVPAGSNRVPLPVAEMSPASVIEPKKVELREAEPPTPLADDRSMEVWLLVGSVPASEIEPGAVMVTVPPKPL